VTPEDLANLAHLRRARDLIDREYARLVQRALCHAADAEIVQEPTDQPWGTPDFAVRDPSGNLVCIDQPPAA
jgi:uncharacterized glyoxalase superfamily protein PhnB